MVNSIKLAQDRVQWQFSMNLLLDSWVPQEQEITGHQLPNTEAVIHDFEFDSWNIWAVTVTCSTVRQVSSCCKVSKFIILIILYGIIHGRRWWGHHWRDDVWHAGLELLHQSWGSLRRNNICYEPVTDNKERTLTVTSLFRILVSYRTGSVLYADVESYVYWWTQRSQRCPARDMQLQYCQRIIKLGLT